MKKTLCGISLILLGVIVGIGATIIFRKPETVEIEVIKYIAEKEIQEVYAPLAEAVPDYIEVMPEIRVYDGVLQVRINNRWKNYSNLEALISADPFKVNAQAMTELETVMLETKHEGSSSSAVDKKEEKKTSFSAEIKAGEVKKETKKTETATTPGTADNSAGSNGSTSSTPSTPSNGGGNGGGGNDNGGNNGGGGAGNNGGGGSSSGETESEWTEEDLF